MFKKILAATLGLLMSISSSFAVDFSGKTVEWLIPFGAGGGSDKWARFYAPLLSQALPGKPNVVVKNCPGGGSTKCANQFANMKNGDGLTIFGDSGSTKFPFLLDDKRVKYNYRDWSKTIVVATPTGGVAYVSPKTGYKTDKDFKKLKGRQLKYGSQGVTSLDIIPIVAFDMLGLNVKPVFGMKGRGPARVAYERGETNIDYQTSSSYLKVQKTLVKEGKAVPLFSWGVVNSQGKIERDPTFPNLPTFVEYYEKQYGKKPGGPAFKAWKAFLAAGFSAQKMVFLPKGTSANIVKVYRDAFAKITTTDEFKKTSKKRLGVYKQVTGSSSEGILLSSIEVDEKSKAWLKGHLSKKYGAKF